ncbi:MAG TPA: hypothetical protein VLZ81_16055, partial [Blastocatellia bacterium]|nr:hypothetical protein [Blastocatellia bacterium]
MRKFLTTAAFQAAAIMAAVAMLFVVASATSFIKPADDDMIISSRAIITAKVISRGTQYDANTNHVFTYIRLKVGKVLKGSLATDEIVLKQLGGQTQDYGTSICSAPSFSAGERVLLYLDTWPTDGSIRVHENFLGKFSIVRDPQSGKLEVERSMPPETALNQPATGQPSTDQMELQAYMKMLSRRVAADAVQSQQFEEQYYSNAPMPFFPPDYDARAQIAGVGFTPDFHLFNPPGRWFQVDSGQPVMYVTNPTNSPDTTGAVADVDAAMAAWSGVSGCALRVMDGGSTTVCQRVANEGIADFNNCQGFFSPGVCAATLGEGGFDFNRGSTKVVGGTTFFQITDGFASINPYAACSFIGQISNLREVLTHEMGHSLGMGHSWEPDFGGSPTAAEADATMFYSAHFDGRGASVHSDDMAGITFIYPGSGSTTPPNYMGFVDASTCTSFVGWAADKNRLNTSINVEVYDGTTLLTTVLANASRPDVGAVLGDNGLHGFNIPAPPSLLDGNTHSVHIQFETSATNLTNSPFSLKCGGAPAPSYIGNLDSVTCTSIIGWVADKNRLNTPIDVEIYDGTTLIDTVLANILRTDVGGFLGDNGLHGFNIPTPSSLLDGNVHTVHAKFETSAIDAGNSPASFKCGGSTPPNYIGYVDTTNCTSLVGWAADKNRLNVSINVEIYDGTTLISTVLANVLRADVGGFIGDNGLHGFNIPTPAALQDGRAHTVHIKFEDSTTDLNSSPFTLTCGGVTPPNYTGFVDAATCTAISGWAADKNRRNVSINVEIYNGATLLAIVPATLARPDVGAALGDNGLHGYSYPAPAALRSGTADNIHVKFETSTTELTHSPASLTCPAETPNYQGHVDAANCSIIGGWVADSKRLNMPITVSIYDGTTLLVTVTANQSRPDVGAFLKDNGLHGFTIPVPAALLTGTAHSVHIKFESSATDVTGSPATLTCSAQGEQQPDSASGFYIFRRANDPGRAPGLHRPTGLGRAG